MSFVTFEELKGTWLENAKLTLAKKRDPKTAKMGGFSCLRFLKDPHVETIDDFINVYLESSIWGANPDGSFYEFLKNPDNYYSIKNIPSDRIPLEEYNNLLDQAVKPVKLFKWTIGKPEYSKTADPVYYYEYAGRCTFDIYFKGVNCKGGSYNYQCVFNRDSLYGTNSDADFFYEDRLTKLIDAIKINGEYKNSSDLIDFSFVNGTLKFHEYGRIMFSLNVTDKNIGYTIASLKRFRREIYILRNKINIVLFEMV